MGDCDRHQLHRCASRTCRVGRGSPIALAHLASPIDQDHGLGASRGQVSRAGSGSSGCTAPVEAWIFRPSGLTSLLLRWNPVRTRCDQPPLLCRATTARVGGRNRLSEGTRIHPAGAGPSPGTMSRACCKPSVTQSAARRGVALRHRRPLLRGVWNGASLGTS